MTDEMKYEDYVSALKGVPATGLYYFSMDYNSFLYKTFKDYLKYLLEHSDVWISNIDDIVIEEEENKVLVTIEYSFDDFVDLFDVNNDGTTLSSSVKLEFDDSYYNDIYYESMDLLELADDIVDMFATHVEEKIDEETELKRENIIEVEKDDEYQERYGEKQ